MITLSEHLRRTVLILDALKNDIKTSEISKYIPWFHLNDNKDQFDLSLDDSSIKLFTVRRSFDSWDEYYAFSNKFIIFQEKGLKHPLTSFVRVSSDISEEALFQNSMSIDYGSLKYEDIENLHKIKAIIQHMLGIKSI